MINRVKSNLSLVLFCAFCIMAFPASIFKKSGVLPPQSVDNLELGATFESCVLIEDPVTDEEFLTIWKAPATLTISEIFCQSIAGTSVALDLEIDDGSPTGVNGSDITCSTSEVTDSALGGDTTMAVDNKLDLDFGTVSGAVTDLSVCWKYTYD